MSDYYEFNPFERIDEKSKRKIERLRKRDSKRLERQNKQGQKHLQSNKTVSNEEIILSQKIKKSSIVSTVLWSIVAVLGALVISGAILDIPILYSYIFQVPLYILLPISLFCHIWYKSLQKDATKMTLKKQGLNFNKEISVDKYTMMIDSQNKKWCIMIKESAGKTYNFSDLISYEIYEDGKNVVKGTAGKALIGGAFFGITGAIIGSSSKRNINDYCTNLKLLIRINNIQQPLIELPVITSQTNKDSWMYKNYIKKLQEICAYLEFMLNNKSIEEPANNETPSTKANNPEIHSPAIKTKKENLLELKELLEDGLITEEEYNKMRENILK